MAYIPEIWTGTAVLLPLGPSVQPARTVPWPQWATPAGGSPTMLQVRWPQKAVDAVLDYGLDLTGELAALGDTIKTATVSADQPSLTIGNPTVGATTVAASVSGGTAFIDCVVTWTIATAGGRTYVAVVHLLVVPDDESDLYLTDGAGNILEGPGGAVLLAE
jgi:hypothetical protein